jgi:hypothetical protein
MTPRPPVGRRGLPTMTDLVPMERATCPLLKMHQILAFSQERVVRLDIRRDLARARAVGDYAPQCVARGDRNSHRSANMATFRRSSEQDQLYLL